MDDATLDESSGIYLENGFYAQESKINGRHAVICSLEQRIYYYFSIHQKKQLKTNNYEKQKKFIVSIIENMNEEEINFAG